ncbi:MAG: hypothetical protein AAF959_22770 [Cyanobacteria bacterium P01_D01_bin.56]
MLTQRLVSRKVLSLLCLGGLFTGITLHDLFQVVQAAPLSETVSSAEENSSFDGTELAQGFPPEASVYSKYFNLSQVLNCPEDGAVYGDFHDYGYWGGGSWCGQQGEPGYWVWSEPNWYVWEVDSE